MMHRLKNIKTSKSQEMLATFWDPNYAYN